MKMNGNFQRCLRAVLAMFLAALVTAPGWADDPWATPIEVILPVGPIIPPNHVRDEFGNPPASDATALWRFCSPATALCPAGTKVPLLSPDGASQVTWGAWRKIEGTVRTSCVDDQTHFTVHVRGAQPRAVYTVWLAFVSTPPATAAGNPDGTNNVFTTSASGEGQVSFFRPGDDQTLKSPRCVLASPDDVHIILAYHMDGMSYGPGPGDPSTQAFHAFSVVK